MPTGPECANPILPHPPVKRGPGRPSKLTPEARDVALRMAELGVGQGVIAQYLGVDLRTLQRWRHRDDDFSHELEQARGQAVASVWLKLLENVSRNNQRAIELYLRLRAPEDFRHAEAIIRGEESSEAEPNAKLVVMQPIAGDGRRSAEEVVLDHLRAQGWTILAPGE